MPGKSATPEVCEKELATFSEQTPSAPDLQNAPEIPFESVPFPKLAPDSNLGEALGVAVNSKGQVAVLHHPGNAGTGPVYGGATSQVLIFDQDGNYLREVGRGVYGLTYGHYVRFDKYDNLWVVDKAAMSVMKFNPEGRVVMNLGRRKKERPSLGIRVKIRHRPMLTAFLTAVPTLCGTTKTISTLVTVITILELPSSTSTGNGLSLSARRAAGESTRMKTRATLATRIALGSTARRICTWPIEATGAFKSLTSMAISRDLSF